MVNIFERKIGNTLHHAYLIEGDASLVKESLKDFLTSRGMNMVANPDVLIEDYESITMDQALVIKSYQSERATNSKEKIFIISTRAINHEAENALLKVFEEPTEGTHFFFIVPKVEILPDTLRSRAHIIRISQEESEGSRSFTEKFLKENITNRLSMITELISEHKDDGTSGPLRSHAVQLLDSFEVTLRNKNREIVSADVEKFNELLKARKYLSTPGASVKMILEHIALVI